MNATASIRAAKLFALGVVLALSPSLTLAETVAPPSENPPTADKPSGTPEAIAPATPVAPKSPSPRPSLHLNDAERQVLQKALAEGDSFKVRIQAALMLGRRGDKAHDLSALRQALAHDEHYAARGAAAMAIGNLDAVEGIEPLLVALGDEDAFVRRASRKALLKLARPEAVPYLLMAREHPEGTARMVAVEILGGLTLPEAHHALISFLGDDEPAVQTAVERALRSWDRETQVSAILAALGQDSFRVRAHAAALCGPLQDSRLLMPLAQILATPLEPSEVQEGAALSLALMRALIDVEDHVKRVQGLVDRDARLPSIVLLGFASSPRAVEVLLRTTQDSDPRVRFYAVQALGRSKSKQATKRLKAMLDDPSNKRIMSALRTALRALES